MVRWCGKNWRWKTGRADIEIRCRETGGKEDMECNGRTALRDIWKGGGEWRTTAKDIITWRLLIEKVVREKRTLESNIMSNICISKIRCKQLFFFR